MKKNIFIKWIPLVVILGVLTLSGCKKTESSVSPETPQTIFDLKVSLDFNWKTVKAVTVNISGLPVPVKVRNTFYVKSADGKAIYYNDLLEMDQNYTIQVSVPSYETQIVASYGTISKTLDISGSTVSFDYIVE